MVFLHCLWCRLLKYQLKFDWQGPVFGQVWKLKPEGAYEKILMENFRNDPLIVEATRLGLLRNFYKKDTEYYHTTMRDFYDRLQKEESSTNIKIEYVINGENKVFKISKKKISRVYGSPYGNDMEQIPKGNRPLSD